MDKMRLPWACIMFPLYACIPLFDSMKETKECNNPKNACKEMLLLLDPIQFVNLMVAATAEPVTLKVAAGM